MLSLNFSKLLVTELLCTSFAFTVQGSCSSWRTTNID